MNTINVKVSFKNGVCYKDGIDLITGDYNSTKIIFNFDIEDGTKMFEMKNPSGEIVFLKKIENNEVILVGQTEDGENASLFKEAGEYIYEISLYDGDSKLTSAFDKLIVNQEQVVIDGKVVDVYLPAFDELMNEVHNRLKEMENINITAEKVDKTTTVEITGKDGKTKTIEIYDGKDGKQGETGAPGTTVYSELSDKPSINGNELNGNKTGNQLGLANLTDIKDFIKKDVTSLDNFYDKKEIDSKTKDFITKTVDNLENYYLKNETYNQSEIDTKISTIISGSFKKVDELPEKGESNYIYLVPADKTFAQNIKNEFIWLDEEQKFEQIGSTQLDLEPYVNIDTLNKKLEEYVTKNMLDNYYKKTETYSNTEIDDKIDEATRDSLQGLERYVNPDDNSQTIVNVKNNSGATELIMEIDNFDIETDVAVNGVVGSLKGQDFEDRIKDLEKNSYDNIYDEKEGYPIIAENAKQSKVKKMKIYGNSEQENLKGYQLFDLDKALNVNSVSKGGATVTKNADDGTFIISGNGNLTETFAGNYTDFSHEETMKLLKEGNLYLKCEDSLPRVFVEYVSDTAKTLLMTNEGGNLKTKSITEKMINEPNGVLRLSFYGAESSEIIPNTIKPILYQEGDGKWEKFTNGEESPSPDFPSEIRNVEPIKDNDENSYFLKGKITGKNLYNIENNPLKNQLFYDNSGNKVSWAETCGIENYIEVKSETKYILSNDLEKNSKVVFYDKDKNFLGIGGNVFKTPIETKYILFGFGNIIDKNFPSLIQLEEVNENENTATDYEPYKEKELLYNMDKENLFDNKFRQGDRMGTSRNNCVNSETNLLLENKSYTVVNNLPSTFKYAVITSSHPFPNDIDKIYDSGWIPCPQSKTFNANGKYFSILVSYANENKIIPSDISDYNFKLFEGDSPYFELSKIENTKDDLDFISGVLNKKIEKYVFNGDEKFYANQIGTDRVVYYVNIFENKKVGENNALCSHFKYKGDAQINTLGNSFSFNNLPQYKNFLYFQFEKTIVPEDNVEECKAWFKKQYDNKTPVTIYYELEDSKTYQLNPNNIELFEGYNRITIEDKYGIIKEAEITYLTSINDKFATIEYVDNAISNILGSMNTKLSKLTDVEAE